MDQMAVDAIVAGVDFTTIVTGIGAMGAVIMGILVARKGAKILMGFVGR